MQEKKIKRINNVIWTEETPDETIDDEAPSKLCKKKVVIFLW